MRDFTAAGSPLFMFDCVKLSAGATAISTFVEGAGSAVRRGPALGAQGSALRLRGEQIRSES